MAAIWTTELHLRELTRFEPEPATAWTPRLNGAWQLAEVCGQSADLKPPYAARKGRKIFLIVLPELRKDEFVSRH